MSRFTSTMVISAVFLIGVACGGGGGSGGVAPMAATTEGGETVIVGPCDNAYRDDVDRIWIREQLRMNAALQNIISNTAYFANLTEIRQVQAILDANRCSG